MKIQSISISPTWDENGKFNGRVVLVDSEDTQISLVLPAEVTAQIVAAVTKHVKKQAQAKSIDFFNGMANVGLLALEHQA